MARLPAQQASLLVPAAEYSTCLHFGLDGSLLRLTTAKMLSSLPSPYGQVMYDRGTEAWALVLSIVAQLQARGACNKMFPRLMWAAFCRFFRQMLIAAKVCLHQSALSLAFASGVHCTQSVTLKPECSLEMVTSFGAHAFSMMCPQDLLLDWRPVGRYKTSTRMQDI